MQGPDVQLVKVDSLHDLQFSDQATPQLTPGGVVHFFPDETKTYVFASHFKASCGISNQFAFFIQSLDGSECLHDVVQEFRDLCGDDDPGDLAVLQGLNLLYSCGFLSDSSDQSPREIKRKKQRGKTRASTPSLTLALTSGCNLGCAYCYASAAENPKNMSQEVWETSIDYFVGQWIGRANKATLFLHGGGEPTLDARRLVEVVNRFCKKCDDAWIEPEVVLQTNGAFAPLVRDLIVEKKIVLSVSLDGDAQVQDYQRPFINGKSSFDRIIENICFVADRGIPVGLIATVTHWSLPRMINTVEMAHRNGIKAIKFGVIEITGRAKKAGMTKPNMKVFTRNLIDCIRLGAKYGIDVRGAVSPDSPLQTGFCGVASGQPIVTPEGLVTTCVEVLEKDDPLADTFFIGSVSEKNDVSDGKQLVQISTEQLDRLSKRRIEYIPNCDSCFLKRQCVGGCPAQSLRQEGGDIYTLDKEWCDAMREVNEATIRMRVDGEIDPVAPSVRRQLSFSRV